MTDRLVRIDVAYDDIDTAEGIRQMVEDHLVHESVAGVKVSLVYDSAGDPNYPADVR